MSTESLISIITPSFNHASFIRATIDSVLHQTSASVEYIVIDGGSTDGTVAILEGYGDRLRWISEPDRGQVDAINKGLRLTRGRFVTWVNSDDALVPQAAATVADAIAEHPDAAFVYGDAIVIDETGHQSAVVRTPEFDARALTNDSDFVVQPAAFFSRDLATRAGGIDESLNWTMDWDLFARLSKLAPGVHIPAVLAYPRVYDGTKTATGGLARFAEIDRFIQTYADRRFPPAFTNYAAETLLQAVGAWFRRTTSRLALDPSVPSAILGTALGSRPAAAGPAALGARMLRHPVRSLSPDVRPLRRDRRVRVVRASGDSGVSLTLPLPDQVADDVLRFGGHRPAFARFLTEHLQPRMTVIDVGAHIGYFATLVAMSVGAGGEVHAFEPSVNTAAILRANAASFPQIRVVDTAVSDRDGTADLRVHQTALCAFDSLVDLALPELSGVEHRRVPVSSVTLDSYCESLGLRPDLVKVHTIGAESLVVAGMTRLIDEVRPVLTVCFNDVARAVPAVGAGIVADLIERGYRAFDPVAVGLRPHRQALLYASDYVVFVPV